MLDKIKAFCYRHHIMTPDPCYHCHTLAVRAEKMARRAQRYLGRINHEETALVRLAYSGLVGSITAHYEEAKHIVDFSATQEAVLALPFEG